MSVGTSKTPEQDKAWYVCMSLSVLVFIVSELVNKGFSFQILAPL